jgi:hypothetical protein
MFQNHAFQIFITLQKLEFQQHMVYPTMGFTSLKKTYIRPKVGDNQTRTFFLDIFPPMVLGNK